MNLDKPKKIFIVDDDPFIAEALTDYLTREIAHDIQIYETGEDCLKNLSGNPDVIVLDYFLNSVQREAANGMKILESIKKSYPNIHVIMLSNQERYAIAMQTIQKGAEQYVIKDENAFDKIKAMIAEFK